MDWQRRIAKAAVLVTVKYGIPGLKHAMDLNGYYGGPVRLPLTPVGPEAKERDRRGIQRPEGLRRLARQALRNFRIARTPICVFQRESER